jgi:phosphoribosylglycinamide formyltransferase-1
MAARRRVVILISGRGSNMESLIRAAADADYPASIVGVVADRRGTGGVPLAAAAGVPTEVVDRTDYPDRSAFEDGLETALARLQPDLVCLAGFMRILSRDFTLRWSGRVLNIHPSLLPSFRGLDTHERALAAGVRIHGCTVHFVSPELDAGPIVAQAAVPVLGDDTPASLAARVLAAEHRLYPWALALVASGAARLEGETVRLRGDGASASLFPGD